MATKELRYGPNGRRETGRWRARCKEDWTEHYLGLFDTREEAERMEREFRAAQDR